MACLDISALISILHSCSFSTFVYSAIATCISICVIVLKIAAKCLCKGGGGKRKRGKSSRTSCIINMLMHMLAIIKAGQLLSGGVFYIETHDTQMYIRNWTVL